MTFIRVATPLILVSLKGVCVCGPVNAFTDTVPADTKYITEVHLLFSETSIRICSIVSLIISPHKQAAELEQLKTMMRNN